MGFSSNLANDGNLIPSYRSIGISTFEYRPFGFLRGGTTGSTVTTAEGHNAVTLNTQALSTAQLQTATAYSASGNLTKEAEEGYTIGGYFNSTTPLAYCDKVDYTTFQGSVVTGMNLTIVRCGSNSLDHQGYEGYVIGGNSLGTFAGTFYQTSDKVRYAVNITQADASTNCPIGRCIAASCSQSESFGYILGGYISGASNTAASYKTNYITSNTSAVVGANLTVAKRFCFGTTQLQKYFGNDVGYVTGGYTTTYSATTDEIDYSTDTTSAKTGMNLNTARYGSGVLTFVSKGTVFGGNTSGGLVVTAESLNFSTETTSIPASQADLSLARTGISGVCGGMW